MNTVPTTHNPLPPRGSFPKGPKAETVAQRRQRYELWVLATDGGRPDYEVQSVRFYRDKGSASLAACETQRCWECVAGNEDANGQSRIAECSNTTCGLWPVRPYQPKGTPRASRRTAVRAYCSDCVGRPVGGTWKEVQACPSVTCGLWPARPGQLQAEPDASEASADVLDGE